MKKLKIALFLTTLSLIFSPQSFAIPSLPTPNLPVTDGTINAMTRASDGTLYIGGNFSYLGPYTGSGVPVSILANDQANPFPQVNGYVTSTISDGSNGWYLGGYFTQVGSTLQNYIAHVRSDGTVDPNFTLSLSGPVNKLFLNGSTLYVVGNGAGTAGSTSGYVAAYTVSTTAAPTAAWQFITNTGGQVGSITVIGNYVYVGGSFTSLGSTNVSQQPVTSLARINTSTSPVSVDSTWTPSLNITIYALAQDSQGRLYVGGASGNSSLVRFNSSGTLDVSWNPNPTTSAVAVGNSAPIFSIVITTNNSIYVAGTFTNIGSGTPVNQTSVAKIEENGTVLASGPSSWRPTITGGFAYTLTTDGSSFIYMAGSFNRLDNQIRNNVAKVTLNQGQDTGWQANTNGTVWTLALNGNSLFLGGGFSSVGGKKISSLAAVSPTGQISPWDPSVTGIIYALKMSGTTLYAGGAFSVTGANRNTLTNLAAWNISTTQAPVPLASWTGPATPLNGPVNAMTIVGSGSSGKLFVAGAFTQTVVSYQRLRASFGGFQPSRNYAVQANTYYPLLSLSLSDGSYSNFTSTGANGATVVSSNFFDGPVSSLDSNNNSLYVGGIFLAAYNIQSADYPPSRPPQGATTMSTTIQNGNLISINLQTGQLGSIYSLYAEVTSPIGGLSIGNINTIKTLTNNFYIGGSFDMVELLETNFQTGAFNRLNSTSINNLLQVDTSSVGQPWYLQSGSINPVNASGSPSQVSSIAVTPDGSKVYIGGLFDQAGIGPNQKTRNNLLEYSLPTITNWAPNPTGEVKVLDLVGSTLYAAGSFTEVGGTPRSGLAVFSTPTVQFNTATGSGNQTAGTVNVPISLSQTSNEDVTVNYTVAGTNATQGVDFNLNSGSVVINATRLTASLPLAILSGTTSTSNKSVIITLQSATNATLGTNTTFTYTMGSGGTGGTAGGGGPTGGSGGSSTGGTGGTSTGGQGGTIGGGGTPGTGGTPGSGGQGGNGIDVDTSKPLSGYSEGGSGCGCRIEGDTQNHNVMTEALLFLSPLVGLWLLKKKFNGLRPSFFRSRYRP